MSISSGLHYYQYGFFPPGRLFRLVLQAPERTLTEAEVDASVAAVTDGIAAAGWRLRA
jgi:hypothetical protein